MQYFSIAQIILLVFVIATNVCLIGWFFFADDTHSGSNDVEAITAFCLWCIYIVLSMAVYFYLGNI